MICEDCGNQIEIGSWPFCPDHGKAQPSKGFEAFYHYGLDKMVTGIGDINAGMRPHWDNDAYIHIVPSDRTEAQHREIAERRAERRARTLEGKHE